MEFVNKHRSPRLYLVFSDLQRSQHRVVISVFTRVMVILSSVKDDPLQFKVGIR